MEQKEIDNSKYNSKENNKDNTIFSSAFSTEQKKTGVIKKKSSLENETSSTPESSLGSIFSGEVSLTPEKKEKSSSSKKPAPDAKKPKRVTFTSECTIEENNAIKEIIYEFSKKDPAIRYDLEKNRAPSLRLFRAYGLPNVLSKIKYAFKIWNEEFAPVITTPEELLNKISKLEAYYSKQQPKKEKSTGKYDHLIKEINA